MAHSGWSQTKGGAEPVLDRGGEVFHFLIETMVQDCLVTGAGEWPLLLSACSARALWSQSSYFSSLSALHPVSTSRALGCGGPSLRLLSVVLFPTALAMTSPRGFFSQASEGQGHTTGWQRSGVTFWTRGERSGSQERDQQGGKTGSSVLNFLSFLRTYLSLQKEDPVRVTPHGPVENGSPPLEMCHF